MDGDRRILRITLKHLLQHSGGWDRDEVGDPVFWRHVGEAMGVSEPVDQHVLISYMMSQKLQFTPGRFLLLRPGFSRPLHSQGRPIYLHVSDSNSLCQYLYAKMCFRHKTRLFQPWIRSTWKSNRERYSQEVRRIREGITL